LISGENLAIGEFGMDEEEARGIDSWVRSASLRPFTWWSGRESADAGRLVVDCCIDALLGNGDSDLPTDRGFRCCRELEEWPLVPEVDATG
jgi:hypothetical protein